MQENCYIYRHIRLDTQEVFYVGMAKKEKKYSGPGREYYRAHNPRRRSGFWNNVVAKTPYEVEIMVEDLTWEEAKQKEIEFIKLYGRRNLSTSNGTLTNLTDGGEGNTGYKPTQKVIDKIRISRLGYKHSLATLTKMRESSLKINKNTTGRKIKNLETGFVYKSLLEACRDLSLNPDVERTKVDKRTSTRLERVL